MLGGGRSAPSVVSLSPGRATAARHSDCSLGVESHDAATRQHAADAAAKFRAASASLVRMLEQGERLRRSSQDAHEAEDGVAPLRREELAGKLALDVSWQAVQNMKRRLGDDSLSDASLVRDLRDLSAGGKPSQALLEAMAGPDPGHEVALGVSAGVLRTYSEVRDLAANPPQGHAQLLQDLRRTEPVVERLRKTAEQCGSERQRAVADEDYPSAWTAQEREIGTLEELVTVVLERVGHLESSAGDDQRAIAATNKAMSELDGDVESGKAEVERWVQDLQSDDQRIDSALEEAEAEHSTFMQEAGQERERFTGELDDNARQQVAVINRIDELFGTLVELGGDRSRILQASVALEKDAQGKRAAHKQVLAAADQHRALLGDLRGRGEALLANLDAVRTAADRERNTLLEGIEAARAEVAAAAIRERRVHYREFGSLYAMLGDRLYSQERREEELDSQADAARWRLKIARDTMDPAGVSACRENVRELEALRAESREAAASIRRRMDEAAQDAAITEEVLIQNGEQVQSAVELVREELAARAARLSAARKEAHAKRGDAVDAQAEAASALRPPPSDDAEHPPSSPTARIPPLTGTRSPPPACADASERRRRAYEQRLAQLDDAPAASPPPPSYSWASPVRTAAADDAARSPPAPVRDAPRGPAAVAPAPWSDVPSAEALRRRAEELRKAAEEARERAAQHRAKAEALGRQRRSDFTYSDGTTA